MTWRQALWVGAVLAVGILAMVVAMGAIETLRDGATYAASSGAESGTPRLEGAA